MRREPFASPAAARPSRRRDDRFADLVAGGVNRLMDALDEYPKTRVTVLAVICFLAYWAILFMDG